MLYIVKSKICIRFFRHVCIYYYAAIRKDQVEKRHRLSHHERHEEHEGQVRKMSRPIFVSFMIFMVKRVVLGLSR